MSIIDIIFIIILIVGAIIGYKDGAISSILHMIGALLIFVLAFYLKGPVSMILFELLPFNIQSGIFEGISSFNFLIYEGIAFLILIIVLSIILKILLRLTKVLNKVINKTIILALPNKLIGLLFGALRYFIFGFIYLFIISLIPYTSNYIKSSSFSMAILNNTPILTSITKDFNHTIKDIYALIDKYDEKSVDEKEKLDYEVLDVLLKYDIVTPETVKKMDKNNKIKVENVDELINKYEK